MFYHSKIFSHLRISVWYPLLLYGKDTSRVLIGSWVVWISSNDLSYEQYSKASVWYFPYGPHSRLISSYFLYLASSLTKYERIGNLLLQGPCMRPISLRDLHSCLYNSQSLLYCLPLAYPHTGITGRFLQLRGHTQWGCPRLFRAHCWRNPHFLVTHATGQKRSHSVLVSYFVVYKSTPIL